MRILGRIRLSRLTEESTSVERQRELIENWANTHGHEIVGWAEDIDVSGSLSPFDTPELGQWLKKPKMHEWDILVAWKLDRVARNAIALNNLFGWMNDNKKILVSVSENLDLSTWVGRMVAGVIAGVAEGELEAIKERVGASKKRLRQIGRWNGGNPLFGYRQVPKEGGGWELGFDPEEKPWLDFIVKEFLKGTTSGSIATQLNEKGAPTAFSRRQGTDAKWDGGTVRQLLRNSSLLGWSMHEGKPVLDDEGRPVRLGPAAVTVEQFNKIQNLLEKSSQTRSNPAKNSPLLDVLMCWHCGGKMHYRRTTAPSGKVYGSYQCINRCKQHAISGEHLHPMVEEQFKQELGKFEVLEKKEPSYISPETELAEARASYKEVADFLGEAPDKETRDILFSQLTKISKRIKELEAQVATQDEYWEGTGETYGDVWDRLDTEGRRQLMVKTGIIVRARQLNRGTRHAPGIIEMEFKIPARLEENLREL